MTTAIDLRPYEVICDVSDRDAWLDRRADGIGASEIAGVLGESPWISPLALYATKLRAYERDLSDSEPVYWGNKLEAPILEAYQERTGRRTRKAGYLLRSVQHPWALCTLDGETGAANDTFLERPWPLEVKNTSSFKADEWENGPPPHYLLQLQQQLLVTGATKGTIAALIGGQRMVWCDVPRDDDVIRRIVYHGSRFWQRVVARDMPMPDGTESSRKALGALFPEGHGTIVLPATASDAADEIEAMKAERKKLDERIDLAENAVKAALGLSEIGVLPDGRSFSWKTQSRKEFVVKASSFRVLRLHQPKHR
jgi:putative phage-type endonuclease